MNGLCLHTCQVSAECKFEIEPSPIDEWWKLGRTELLRYAVMALPLWCLHCLHSEFAYFTMLQVLWSYETSFISLMLSPSLSWNETIRHSSAAFQAYHQTTRQSTFITVRQNTLYHILISFTTGKITFDTWLGVCIPIDCYSTGIIRYCHGCAIAALYSCTDRLNSSHRCMAAILCLVKQSLRRWILATQSLVLVAFSTREQQRWLPRTVLSWSS